MMYIPYLNLYWKAFSSAPQVVYSKVKVRSLPKDGVTNNATGYTVSEFYTAKDYPVITEETTIKDRRPLGGVIARIFNLFDYYTGSQGHAIRLNDMHGKPKANWVYAENKPDQPLSGSEIFYRSKNATTADGIKRELNNENVPVITQNGSLIPGTIGREHDLVLDSRQHKSLDLQFGLGANMDGFLAMIIPRSYSF